MSAIGSLHRYLIGALCFCVGQIDGLVLDLRLHLCIVLEGVISRIGNFGGRFALCGGRVVGDRLRRLCIVSANEAHHKQQTHGRQV